MPDTFQLQLVTPERLLVEEQVTEAQIPALDGYIGVLPGHAPLLSELKPGGVLTYRREGGEENVLAIYGGFVEVISDRVRVLADSGQRKEEIDLEAARQRVRRAEENLVKSGAEAIDPAVALDEAIRAQAAVEAATR
jgi:F-type H+-transporting ATPase subunit epsilon